ncbi:hypothetical protein MBLNU13_g06055t1 [Cladosporium sp. NU13]
MATTDGPPTEHERHQIAPEHDLIIVVKELNPRMGSDGRRFMRVHEFEVATAVMCEYKHFKVVSFSKQWASTGKDFFEIKGDDLAALEIWLRLLHGCLGHTKVRTSISTIWNLLVLAQKYGFDGHNTELKDWFSAWYAENIAKRVSIGEDTCRELLYPEDAGSVDPIHKEHHMKINRVIGSLNGARGRLRTKLHGRLYDPCWSLLGGATCKIREKVFYQYHKGLQETGAWPLEVQGYRHSINELLGLLRRFKYQDPHLKGEESCEKPLDCMSGPKFSKLVADAIAHVDVQFDGLCLDCMNVSGARYNDDDYWRRNEPGVWGDKCRIQHGQSTWYFSFVGRSEDRDKFQKKWKTT